MAEWWEDVLDKTKPDDDSTAKCNTCQDTGLIKIDCAACDATGKINIECGDCKYWTEKERKQ